MATKSPSASSQSQLPELNVTRILDAPRELVFKVWTDPKHLAQWWGPHEFTNPVCEVDARPGGAIRIHMRGPAGTPWDMIYPNKGVFHEIVEPERIIFALSLQGSGDDTIIETLNTVTFEEYNGKTKLTLHVRVMKAAPEAAPHLAGMSEGWGQSLDRLTSYLSQHSIQ